MRRIVAVLAVLSVVAVFTTVLSRAVLAAETTAKTDTATAKADTSAAKADASATKTRCFHQGEGQGQSTSRARRSRRGDVLPSHAALPDLPEDGRLQRRGR